jgi:hypothetical protein
MRATRGARQGRSAAGSEGLIHHGSRITDLRPLFAEPRHDHCAELGRISSSSAVAAACAARSRRSRQDLDAPPMSPATARGHATELVISR